MNSYSHRILSQEFVFTLNFLKNNKKSPSTFTSTGTFVFLWEILEFDSLAAAGTTIVSVHDSLHKRNQFHRVEWLG